MTILKNFPGDPIHLLTAMIIALYATLRRWVATVWCVPLTVLKSVANESWHTPGAQASLTSSALFSTSPSVILTRSCLSVLLGLMLWFAAAAPAQAQYNDCPALTGGVDGGVVWLDLTNNQCTNTDPGATTDAITVEFNALDNTYIAAYFSASPPNTRSFGTVSFAGNTLTEGSFSPRVSCPSGCNLSGTYGGSPFSATVSGTSVGPSGPVDTTAPTLLSINRQSPMSELTTQTTVVWRFTFSEPMLNADSIALGQGGSLFDSGGRIVPQGFVEVTPSIYDLTANITGTETADGFILLGLDAAGNATDLAGNPLPDNRVISQPYTYDSTGPTVSITSSAADPTNASPIQFLVTFNESVSGITANDFTVTGGVANSTPSSGSAINLDVTPSGDGPVTVSLPADRVFDPSGNGNAASNVISIQSDRTVPTVTFGPLVLNNGQYTSSITLSEPATGLDVSDLTLTNFRNFSFNGGGTSYTLTITPANAGQVSASIAAGRFTDAAGNGNSASNTVTATYVPANTAPTANAGADGRISARSLNNRLDGSGSDPDTGQTLTYRWTAPAGITLEDPNVANPKYTVRNTGIAGGTALTFTLVVNDGIANSAPDTVVLTVNNQPNVVTQGDIMVASGATARLDSTGTTDADGDALEYQWDCFGPDFPSFSRNGATISFTAPVIAPGGSDIRATCILFVRDDFDTVESIFEITVTAPPLPAPSTPDMTAATDSGAITTDNLTNITRPTFTGTAQDGALVTLLSGSTPIGTQQLTAGQTGWSITPAADLAEGAQQITATATFGSATSTPSPATEITIDATDPTATITPLVRSGGSYSTSITLSEASNGFDLSNLSLVNASATLSGSGTLYTATLTPRGPGALSVSVAQDSFTDIAGNGNVASDVVATVFNTAPTVNAGPDQSVSSDAIVTLDGTGSDANDADQTLTYAWNQTAGPLVTLDDATATEPAFTAPTLAIGDGDATLTFALTVDDGFATASDSVTITVTAPLDLEPPVISNVADIAVNTDAGVNTASVDLNATVTDNSGETILPTFSIDGAVVTSPYEFPVGSTTVFVDAQDSSGNRAVQQTFNVDVTDTTPPDAPVVIILTATPDRRVDLVGTAEPDSTVTITFPDGSSQSVMADADAGMFAVTSDTPQRSGVIMLVAKDVAGNASTAANAGFVGDDTSPTVLVGALSGPTNGTYTAAITLSEDSTDFSVADLTLLNATATLIGSGSSYSATLTPNTDGTVTLSVAANTFTDAAGNGNEASNQVSAVFDGTAPTVSISGAPETLAGDRSFSVTVTFSEIVTGFLANDISATNATVTGLSGGGASYMATLRASGAGDVQISVPANIAADAAGNDNLASNQLVIANSTVEQTQELIASYMQTRANQLIRNQPSLTPFLAGDRRGSFNFFATQGAGNFDISTNTKSPVWALVNGSWTTDQDSRSEYVFGALGSHRAINENLLVGAMLQFDHLREDTGVASTSGMGWMAGPYFVARSASQPLYFEGRLLYGETSNRVSPFGTYEDSFDTSRMLAQLKVAGELSHGMITLTPFVDASYTTDDQHSYFDSFGNAVPEQGIALGQIDIGLDFSTMMPVGTGELELWGGVSGIWSHTSGSGFASTVTPDYEGGRARFELGINHQISPDQSFTAATYYDGIGASDFESYGLSLGYEMQF